MEHITMKVGNKEAVLHAYLNGLDMAGRCNTRRPAMLILPGGSYEFCSPWEDEPIALAFMAEGYQAFSLYYSVSKERDEQVFPTVLDDAEAALKCIREHAEEWNVDPEKVAVIGFSAGGHLAACLSAAGKEKPNATVLAYARTTGSKPEEVRFIPDVVDFVDRNTPPAFIFGTREDEAVGPGHGMRYAEALQKHHIMYEIHYFERGPHGMSLGKTWSANGNALTVNQAYARWFPMCIDWLKLHFGDFKVQSPSSCIETKARAMDMPLEFFLENEKRREILFEKVPFLKQVASERPEDLADFTLNRLACFLHHVLTEEVMEQLDQELYELEQK